MTDSIIKIEILKAIKRNLSLNEIQLNRLFSEHSINVLIPDSIRNALAKAKKENDEIKIPDNTHYDQRNDIVHINPATQGNYEPKKSLKRKENTTYSISGEEIRSLIMKKAILDMDILSLEKIEGIVNYYITDQPNNKVIKKRKSNKTKQDTKNPTKLKRGELKNIVINTLESRKGKSLNIQKGITLNHKQLKTLYNLACDLNSDKKIDENSFISKVKQIGYSKERLNPGKRKKQ